MNHEALVMVEAINLDKSFTLHTQGGVRISVLEGINLTVREGECVVIDAPSGRGKSTLLRTLYGNYLVGRGQVLIRRRDTMVDLASASPRALLAMRRDAICYVSQFLRVIPRVPTIDLVAEPLIQLGADHLDAKARASDLLEALALPERLWSLAPATFSGGEQQRVNIARAIIAEHPVLLLDEPTASLDAENRTRVLDLLIARRKRGAAMIGVFHDPEARRAIATRVFALPERSFAQ